jgi:hypothetical protein
MTSSPEKQPRSLLVANEEHAPLLGGTSAIEESPLERLISQSTLAQAAAAPSTPFFIEDPESFPSRDSRVPGGPSPAHIYRVSITTLIAGTFCLLHICLVWGSFFSYAWFDTHLTVTVGARTPFEFTTDHVLQRTTLASLLSALLGAGEELSAMVLVLTCLIAPCLGMILCTSWTYGDYQEALKPKNRPVLSHIQLVGFSPRIVAEQLLIRIGFLVFFLLAILDIGTSALALENNNSGFLVTNRSLGGLACYVLGATCAMIVVVVLRFASQEPYSIGENRMVDDSQDLPRGPPDHVFGELRQPLLVVGGAPGMTRFHLGDSEGSHEGDRRLAKWKRLVAYETGVLSVALWLPAVFLPLFRISFDGLVASFMDEKAYEIAFYQIPTTLLQRANTADTTQWIILALGMVFFFLVYVFPLVATSIAVGAWRSPDRSKAAWFYKGVLRLLQPCLCGVVFSAALACAIPAFEPLVGGILDAETAGFCQHFADITDMTCLDVEGQPLIGHWFLLAQGFALELFVSLTLLWKP